MKNLIIALFCIIAISSSLYSLGLTKTSMTADQQFEEVSKSFLQDYFKASPITATGIGNHEYDSLLDDVSATAMAKQLEDLKTYKTKIAAIDITALNQANAIDAKIMLENIDEAIFGTEVMKDYQWNPMIYTGAIGNAIASLIYQEFAPLDQRIANAVERCKRVPAFLEQAKANLGNAPKMHVETAIGQNAGNVSLFREELVTAAAKASPELQKAVKEEGEKAAVAVEKFGEWMKTDLLPKATKDTRLGKELFSKKLQHTLKTTMTAEEIYNRALAEKARIHQDMYKLAAPLYAEYYKKPASSEKDSLKVIKDVLDKIVLDHCKKEEVMDKIKSIMPSLTNFIKEKDLLTLDETQPLVIRETPEYERGVAVASLESPGPLEKNMKSFYNVTPISNEWTETQVESYLREYNNWSLEDLSMHEGIPGHYVQLYYSNRFPSIIRTVFGSGSMIEGWAVYAERMMTDAGYHNNDPKMKLINMKWYLRVACNTILDYGIHANNMSQQDAMDLMTKQGFQEEREAAGKWRRANLTSTQLSTYFVGFSEIWDLRKDYQKKMGDKYTLKQFNETFLSFGSPSVKYIREMMMK